MPQITLTVEVELEVTFDYTYEGAEPDVGIMSGCAQDVSVAFIEGFNAVPKLVKRKVCKYLVNDKPVWEEILEAEGVVTFDPKFEEKLIEKAYDQINEAANEPDDEPDYDERD
jgi:hypothetical protein